MAPKLPVVRAREVIRVAAKLGFVFDRQKGSHAVYRRASDGARVVIPVHPGKDLKPKTLAGILEDLGLTVEQFREML
jgi:predicted RNA binding protein YcfA (HicA-like mRNA interferase family)